MKLKQLKIKKVNRNFEISLDLECTWWDEDLFGDWLFILFNDQLTLITLMSLSEKHNLLLVC